MNFQELMSKASANNSISSKQKKLASSPEVEVSVPRQKPSILSMSSGRDLPLTKSGHKHKDSVPGVSNFAVKAFLEKKEQERKKKKANEEAAKRARIEARIQQNLKANQEKKVKSESTPKSSFLNHPYAQGEEEEEEKSMSVKRKKQDVRPQHQKSAAMSKPSVSGIKSKDINRSATTNNMKKKNSERITKEKSGKSNDLVVNGKKNDTTKAKKKSKTAPAPPNFKELLAIAEQNKSGLKRKTETVTSKDKVEVKASKLKKRHNSDGERELTEIDEKNMRIRNKGKVKEKAVTKTKGKQTELQRKTAFESDKSRDKYRSRGNESSKSLKRTKGCDTLVQNVFDKKASKPLPHYARPQEQKNYYARPTHGYYYDEEEESDLDGFIDDGEDETSAEQTDVSKYIKDIFGYDRRRYAMEDIDDSAMESNYGQIEREEKRSSKIAKLEDEIEILKEQAELKRLRDKLKKSKKPKK